MLSVISIYVLNNSYILPLFATCDLILLCFNILMRAVSPNALIAYYYCSNMVVKVSFSNRCGLNEHKYIRAVFLLKSHILISLSNSNLKLLLSIYSDFRP